MIDWALLLAALIAVESGGDIKAVGDNGKAVGCMQIHPIMVEECNRILKLKDPAEAFEFKIRDRTFESTSRNMAIVYLRHNMAKPRPRDAREMNQYEFCARIWNGGPNGWMKDSTDDYWRKVKIALRDIRMKKQGHDIAYQSRHEKLRYARESLTK